MRIAWSNRVAGALIAVGAAALTAGCDDPLRPSEVAGVYVLREVAGDPLPAVELSNESFTIRVLADTLVLEGDGRGTRVRVEEVISAEGPGPVVPVRDESGFEFRTPDDRIEITLDCPNEVLALCAAGPHLVARRTGDGLRVDGGTLTSRVPLVYERVVASP